MVFHSIMVIFSCVFDDFTFHFLRVASWGFWGVWIDVFSCVFDVFALIMVISSCVFDVLA